MKIRELQLSDLPALAGLYQQFWNEQSDITRMEEAFRKISHAGTHIVLCAEDEEMLIGSVMGVVCPELYGDCRPFLVIENMIVDRNVRRQGVGYALLQELEIRAKARQCTQMILVTEKNRLDACSFYEAYGFQKHTTGYKKKL